MQCSVLANLVDGVYTKRTKLLPKNKFFLFIRVNLCPEGVGIQDSKPNISRVFSKVRVSFGSQVGKASSAYRKSGGSSLGTSVFPLGVVFLEQLAEYK